MLKCKSMPALLPFKSENILIFFSFFRNDTKSISKLIVKLEATKIVEHSTGKCSELFVNEVTQLEHVEIRHAKEPDSFEIPFTPKQRMNRAQSTPLPKKKTIHHHPFIHFGDVSQWLSYFDPSSNGNFLFEFRHVKNFNFLPPPVFVVVAENPINFSMPLNVSAVCGIQNATTAPSAYEIIRQSVEATIPSSIVRIYGSCLYMCNPDDKTTALDLCIEFGKIRIISGKWLEKDNHFFRFIFTLDAPKHHVDIIMSKRKMEFIKDQLENASKTYPTKWENIVRDYRNEMRLIIKATDTITGVNCTISLTNEIYVEASKRMKEYIEAVPMSKSHSRHTISDQTHLTIILHIFNFRSCRNGQCPEEMAIVVH